MATPDKIIGGIVAVEQQIGDFIANGPSDGIGGWVRDGYRTRCNQFANLPGWARALSRPVTGSLGRICQPYYDDQGVDGPVLAPPFTGGQCPEVYIVSYQGTAGTNNSTYNVRRKTFGPVGGARSVDLGGGSFDVEILSSGGLISTQLCSGANPSPGPYVFRSAGVAIVGPDNGGTFSIQTACGADDCGDPEAEPVPGPNPPADPGPLPGPEPTDDPEGGPIPVIPIPPFDDPLGGPTPIEPLPPADGGGGDGGNPPNASGGDGLPGDPDAVGAEAGTATGGEDGEEVDFGPPPEGKVWVGVLVESTVDPRLGNIPGTGPANTVYPTAIANCSLRFATGRSSSFMIKSKWFSLFRPSTALVVEGAFVQAQPGVSCSIRPVSAEICPTNPCEETDNG